MLISDISDGTYNSLKSTPNDRFFEKLLMAILFYFHYNASAGITTNLLTPLMLGVLILYISGGTYSLKSTPKGSGVEKLFIAILFIPKGFARNLLSGTRQRNIFLLILPFVGDV